MDGHPPTLDAVEAVADGAPVTLDPAVLDRATAGRVHLDELVAARRLIYGVTTGYGPLAGRYVDPAHSAALQRNLVYHLASGTGDPLPRRTVRAIMLVRLATLTRGHSAVRPETLRCLADWLNDDLVPVVPERGTVGASGDLTPLAHIALALMGEAEVDDGGTRRPAAEALAERGWAPWEPAAKDGLALVNGTAAMTGIAALNAAGARRAVALAQRLTVAAAEIHGARLEAWRPELGELRPHPGQQAAHARLNELAAGSRRLVPAEPAWLPEDLDGVGEAAEVPQDPYTLRCAPQLFGAVLDALEWHDTTVAREVGAVTDNPVFLPETDAVIHGGNFYGQHVAFAADAQVNALVKTAVHAERTLARLTDERRNDGLPPFLQGNQTGLNSGFMGAQVTASALVAELRTRAHPASIQSVPTNADNQDVVTMGTIAARKAADTLGMVEELLAIHALAIAQAVDLCGKAGFSPASRALHATVRTTADFLGDDRPLQPAIASLAARLRDPGDPLHTLD
ncbi:MAG: HAL/PAL/TAL family ammonia-lyase [Pseudomonadota bacterium]